MALQEWRESCPWRESEAGGASGTAVATPHGTMSLRLHDRIRVDMSVDRAVRVINLKVRTSRSTCPGNKDLSAQ